MSIYTVRCRDCGWTVTPVTRYGTALQWIRHHNAQADCADHAVTVQLERRD